MTAKQQQTALAPTSVARPIVRLDQIKEQAGVDDSSNAITKEQKLQLAQAGTTFVITDMEQQDGDNGPYWMLTIELEGEEDERLLFMGENRGNAALFGAMHEAVVGQGASVGPMRLSYIPPRTNKKGEKKFGFYKLEEVYEESLEALSRPSQTREAIEGTAKLLGPGDELPF